jgi:hypothetical protein
MEGGLDRAVERYQRSIEAHPTAEAHTFLGWTLGFQGTNHMCAEVPGRAALLDCLDGENHHDPRILSLSVWRWKGSQMPCIRWLPDVLWWLPDVLRKSGF